MQREGARQLPGSRGDIRLCESVFADLDVKPPGRRTRSPVAGLGVQGLDQVQIREGDEPVLQQLPGGGSRLSFGRLVLQRPAALPQVREPLCKYGDYPSHAEVAETVGARQECI